MPPRLFTPRTWPPATPTTADSRGMPTMPSASSTAWRMLLTARSRFTIWPLRQPFDSAAPRARNLMDGESSSCSATRAQVFVLPMSRATIWRSFLFKFGLLLAFLRILICPACLLRWAELREGLKNPPLLGLRFLLALGPLGYVLCG